MIIEILIAVIVFALATYFMYKQFKNRKNGVCSCDSCSAKCPNRNSDKASNCNNITFIKKK